MPVLPVTLSDTCVNRQENGENCAYLGCFTASSGNSLPGAVHMGFN